MSVCLSREASNAGAPWTTCCSGRSCSGSWASVIGKQACPMACINERKREHNNHAYHAALAQRPLAREDGYGQGSGCQARPLSLK